MPLKLEWEPYYSLDEDESVAVGDMVAVPFAGRRYVGVVSATDAVLPEGLAASTIKGIYSVHNEFPSVPLQTIAFWRSLSEYYMCTVGEVLKTALPSVRGTLVKAAAPKTAKFAAPSDVLDSAWSRNGTLDSIETALESGKPLLLQASPSSTDVAALCRRVMGLDGGDGGRSVLWMVPDAALVKTLEKKLRPLFGSCLLVSSPSMTPAGRTALLHSLTLPGPYLMIGTRTSLFLPHRNLGIIYIQDEHFASYKLSSQTPRCNVRDAAVMLSAISRSQGTVSPVDGSRRGESIRIVLQSTSPSLESILNVRTGKYSHLSFPGSCPSASVEIVDLRAEIQKNGMAGDIPKTLLPGWNSTGGKTAFVKLSGALFPTSEELAPQIEAIFGPGSFRDDVSADSPLSDDVDTVCVFGLDSILGRNDFRADETALREISTLVSCCPPSLRRIIVLTRQASHPVPAALSGKSCAELSGSGYLCAVRPLMAERKELGLPPFSRMVDVRLNGSLSRTRPFRAAVSPYAAEGCDGMVSLLTDCISRAGFQTSPLSDGCRVILPKDPCLASRKKEIARLVSGLCRDSAFTEIFHYDVDPV